jgi:hypothetical protein
MTTAKTQPLLVELREERMVGRSGRWPRLSGLWDSVEWRGVVARTARPTRLIGLSAGFGVFFAWRGFARLELVNRRVSIGM